MNEEVFGSDRQRKHVMAKLANRGTKRDWKEYHESEIKEKKNNVWFEWVKKTNWSTNQSPSVRRRHVLDTADDRLSQQHKYKWCYHKMNVLSNMHMSSKNGSRKAGKKAREDANYFLRLCYQNNGGRK